MKTAIIAFLICLSMFAFGYEKELFRESPCRQAYLYHFLERACVYGDEIGVRILLAEGADPNGSGYKKYPDCVGISYEFTSPLFQASSQGHLAIVIMLLTSKADPNILEGEGYTPLLIAVEHNRPEIVKILLQYGARIRMKGLYRDPIEVAIEKKYDEILRILLEKK